MGGPPEKLGPLLQAPFEIKRNKSAQNFCWKLTGVLRQPENARKWGTLATWKQSSFSEKRSKPQQIFFGTYSLAEHINEITATEIYKQLIRDFGTRQLFLLLADDSFGNDNKAWQEKGRVANGNVMKKVNFDGNSCQMPSFGLAVRFIIQSSFINWP